MDLRILHVIQRSTVPWYITMKNYNLMDSIFGLTTTSGLPTAGDRWRTSDIYLRTAGKAYDGYHVMYWNEFFQIIPTDERGSDERGSDRAGNEIK